MTDVDLKLMREHIARAYAYGRRDEKAHPSGFVHSDDFVAAVGMESVASYPATYQRLAEEAS